MGEIQAKQRRHLIISGTGRAGTTFLVQLFTELGLDTGYANRHNEVSPRSNAGLEWDLRKEDAPYVVKSPALCERLEEVLQTRNVRIDHAIVPIRDLYSAAESRRAVARKGSHKFLVPRTFGFWRFRKAEDQEAILAQNLYQLLYTLALHDIPVTLLFFPRLAKEPEYLYAKVKALLPGIEYHRFETAFKAVSRPETIHDFTPPSAVNR
jgi:hypothetical protein